MKTSYSQGYNPNFKKSNKKKKGNKANRNLVIFGIVAVSSMYFSGGTVLGFFMAFAIGLLIAAGILFLLDTLLAKPGKRPGAGKSTKQQTTVNIGTVEHSARTKQKSRRFRSIESKNFNWVVEEAAEQPVKVEEKPQIKEIKVEEKKEKFIPYRSPFDPIIKPVQKKELEVGEKIESIIVELASVANMKAVVQKPVEKAQKEVLEEADADILEVKESDDYLDIEEEEVANELEYTTDDGIKTVDVVEPCTEEGVSQYISNELPDVQDDELMDIEEQEEEELRDIDEEMSDEEFEENVLKYEGLKDLDYVGEEEQVLEDDDLALEDIPLGLSHDSGIKALKVYLKREARPEPPKIKVVHKTDDTTIEKKRRQIHVRPPVELLGKRNEPEKEEEVEISHAEYNARKLVDTLASFGVGAKVINISEGPAVTRYELQPNVGVKVSKIVSLADDIALNLAATGVRIEAPIPGKAAVGIEVPNKEVTPVFLRDVIETDEFLDHPSKLAFAVGKDIAGNVVVADIAKMPHLLIAGATGSGKSVCINTLIASILYKASPSEVKLLMVDPKVVELSIYNGIPHLLIPVVTDPKKAAGALNWAVIEMTNRYRLFADNNVRDLKGYNAMLAERGEENLLPQVVIIIDELADLMMVAPNDVEDCICRLAQMARAAGMHLVIATQRPSVDVITGVIKANVPSRISFAVSSQIDSRTILDMAGAEKLLGRGDMLFNPIGEPKPVRVQGGFISDKEVESIVAHLKAGVTAEYDEDILKAIEKQPEAAQAESQNNSNGDDELLPQAIEMVIELGQASASFIQRKFKVGYSRAARIIDQMEAWGVVSKADGSKPRQVLVTKQEWAELNA
ncbi:MAG: DNA translocase FtsK [Clostridia bacterium]|nr:DNA translocase FtsK [Clostridia bacterium]